MQAKKPVVKRRKRCKACQGLFQPDPRTKEKQRYCSKEACQRIRQRQNEKDWRIRHPACVEYQHAQTREWNKAHPEYSRQRRQNEPDLLQDNRDQTQKRMRKLRFARRFDKSKLILTQLVDGKADKCYLAKGSKWLHVRLTKARSWTRVGMLRDNHISCERVANRLPRGRLYDLSGILERPP